MPRVQEMVVLLGMAWRGVALRGPLRATMTHTARAACGRSFVRDMTTLRAASADSAAHSGEYDVVVIGGGHAGTEAAAAAARCGARTALLTQRFETVGEMSCNPSIGGIGKGHLVREVDALGGLMGRAIDEAGIHFRMLNRRKGPAVWGPRAQADRDMYRDAVQRLLLGLDGEDYASGGSISVVEGSAEDVLFEGEGDDRRIVGVRALTRDGAATDLACTAAVITTGTFLRGRCFMGHESYAAGRHMRDTPNNDVEPPSIALAITLEETLGLPLGRLKTGTPPRLDGKTIDWHLCTPQPSEEPPFAFSYVGEERAEPRRTVQCFRTATNEGTHDIVRECAHTLAPPSLTGVGPRYCPSLYKKVERFGERPSHTVWLEPEGLNTDLVYPNGLSGAFPLDVQKRIINSIVGLERAEIVQAGYDVEYDFVDPRSLDHALMVRSVSGLYLAGQICGTTGYEEAASLGIVAGTNAGLLAVGAKSDEQARRFVVGRNEGYIGVLVDDLVTKGTMEPYRMFTSRAEYRLHLRSDNADLRLTRDAAVRAPGLVTARRLVACEERQARVEAGVAACDAFRAKVSDWNAELRLPNSEASAKTDAGRAKSATEVLSMPHAELEAVLKAGNKLKALRDGDGFAPLDVAADARDTVSALCKYGAYLQRQGREMEAFRRNDEMRIPPELEYSAEILPGLSSEERQKLTKLRPLTFADASKISGMTPASLVYLYNHVSSKHYKGTTRTKKTDSAQEKAQAAL